MKRREFLTGAAAAAVGAATAPFVFARRGAAEGAQTREQKLARMAVMSLTFGNVLKLPGAPDNPNRTLEVMDIGEMYADRFGIHNVEMQHSYLLSTEDSWLKDFRARLAKTKSQVSNINLELGGTMTMSADTLVGRLQAIDLTKRWVDHCVTLGCPRMMLNQGQLTEQNKAIAIAALKTMGDYGKGRGVKLSLEPRGGGGGGRRGGEPAAAPAGPPPPPPYVLLTEVIKASGTYANVDLANYGSQEAQHAGMRMMMPFTVGNTHMRLNPAQYDLPAALKILRDELKYTGIYLIEQGIPAGPDPYQNILDVREVVLANM